MLAAADESFAHEGMSPQRTSDSSRTGAPWDSGESPGQVGWERCCSGEPNPPPPKRYRSIPRQPAFAAKVDIARTWGRLWQIRRAFHIAKQPGAQFAESAPSRLRGASADCHSQRCQRRDGGGAPRADRRPRRRPKRHFLSQPARFRVGQRGTSRQKKPT